MGTFSIKIAFITPLILSSTFSAFGAPSCRDAIAQISGNRYPAVTQGDFARDSFGANFVRLAESHQLLDESDQRLVAEGLEVEGFGICGPRCLTNIAKAAANHNPHSRTAEDILRDFMNIYKAVNPNRGDPLLGTDPHVLLLAAKNLPELKNTKITESNFSESNLAHVLSGEKSTVMFVTVSTSQADWHELNILKIEPKTKTLIISDPNYPDNPYRTPYRVKGPGLEFALAGHYSRFNKKKVTKWVYAEKGGLIEWPN